jgi:hypothetical protein
VVRLSYKKKKLISGILFKKTVRLTVSVWTMARDRDRMLIFSYGALLIVLFFCSKSAVNFAGLPLKQSAVKKKIVEVPVGQKLYHTVSPLLCPNVGWDLENISDKDENSLQDEFVILQPLIPVLAQQVAETHYKLG